MGKKKKKDTGPVILTRPNGDPLTPRPEAPMISPSRRANREDPLAILRPASRMMMSAASNRLTAKELPG